MSFVIINGKQVETLDFESDYPDFFEPKPISPKKNKLFADNSGNIHFEVEELESKPIIKNNDSILGKRKLADAFGNEYGDQDRYGQEINDDFFNTNIGHGVSQKKEEPIYCEEILDWCYKYLAFKNLSTSK